MCTVPLQADGTMQKLASGSNRPRCKVLIVVIKFIFLDVMYYRETYCLHPQSPQRCSEMLVPFYQVQDLCVGTLLQNYKMSVSEGCNYKLDDFCTKSSNTHYYVQKQKS